MGILIAALFGGLMIALGLLGAEVWIVAKVPASRGIIERLHPYREKIGMLSIALGLTGTVWWVAVFHYLGWVPMYVLLVVAKIVLLLGLGMIFSFERLRSYLKNPAAPALMCLETLRAKITRAQPVMGGAALVLGILHFIMSL